MKKVKLFLGIVSMGMKDSAVFAEQAADWLSSKITNEKKRPKKPLEYQGFWA